MLTRPECSERESRIPVHNDSEVPVLSVTFSMDWNRKAASDRLSRPSPDSEKVLLSKERDKNDGKGPRNTASNLYDCDQRPI